MTIWGIIPAAGRGQRMQQTLPKQYVVLAGLPILVHSIAAIQPFVEKIVVVLSPEDEYWSKCPIANYPHIITAIGTDTRGGSVLAGLQKLAALAAADDWVLIHDAARPCLERACVERLIHQCKAHPVGGILAIPITDTLKMSQDGKEIEQTFDRKDFWLAQTPQLFRYQPLLSALAQSTEFSDEAMALEASGAKPCLVMGSRRNIKVTLPEDVALANYYLNKWREQQ